MARIVYDNGASCNPISDDRSSNAAGQLGNVVVPNRVIATGQYNATTGLSVSSDPTTLDTADSGNTDRLNLSETLYDERGQVWKTIRHKIDVNDGSDDGNLESFNWYDPDGRAIKSRNPGGLTKTRYDRLGRATHRWTLATVYDHMGRTTATIANYVNGTPSGANADDDNIVRYVYTNGLQTQMWVDLDGDTVQDADDQVTTYTYGTLKGNRQLRRNGPV